MIICLFSPDEMPLELDEYCFCQIIYYMELPRSILGKKWLLEDTCIQILLFLARHAVALKGRTK